MRYRNEKKADQIRNFSCEVLSKCSVIGHLDQHPSRVSTKTLLDCMQNFYFVLRLVLLRMIHGPFILSSSNCITGYGKYSNAPVAWILNARCVVYRVLHAWHRNIHNYAKRIIALFFSWDFI